MPTLQLRRQEDILQEMINSVVALTTLSDLTDSSVLGTMLDAVARQLDVVYLQFVRLTALTNLSEASKDDLDARAKEIVPGVIRRQGARRAIGRVVFSRSESDVTTLTIPSGTTVRTADGTAFSTTETAFITPSGAEQIAGHGIGRDSIPVSATAVEPGEGGNVDAGTVVVFGAKILNVSSVTNVTSFSQGREVESDDAFRARIYRYVASLSRVTVEAIEYVVRGLEEPVTGKQVIFSRVFEDPENLGRVLLYIDDGAGTAATYASQLIAKPIPVVAGTEYANLAMGDYPVAYHLGFDLVLVRGTSFPLVQGVDYFLNPASGRLFLPLAAYGGIQTGDAIHATFTPYSGLIPFVQKVVDGDPNNRSDFPGYRAAGVLVEVRAPTVISFDVGGVITTLAGFDHATIVASATDVLLSYVNGLNMGEGFIRAEAIQRIMDIDGVYDVALDSENIVINETEVLRIGTPNISLE